MSLKVITYCPDVVKYRARLKAHYKSDSGLASRISTNEDETEFWVTPFKTRVLYNGSESICLSKLKEHHAFGVFDDDGNTITPSILHALNIDPLTGQQDPVFEQWAEGEVFGENCIFEALSDERKEKIREFHPATIEYIDEDGNTQTITQGLCWGDLA